ncbi:LPS export ABC transporter ATP-binding protein [soil metagenome]
MNGLAPHSTTVVPRHVRKSIPELSVFEIGKSYGDRDVLNNISLEVSRGEVVGLLGPNGAGKTLCFYAIIGIVAVDQGRILLGRTDVTNLPTSDRARLGLGYLPQEASIFRGMTVEQNITAVLEMIENSPEQRSKMLEGLLREFRIDHVRHMSAIALSGGERRRCEIARAVAANPSVLLLDEPFAGVDPLSIVDIKIMVKDLKKRDIAVLITDHNVHEMVELVDRAYVIYQGRMLFQGQPQEMVADPQVRHLYLGENFAP